MNSAIDEIQLFNFENNAQIRTVTHNHQPHFVGRDVAEALGYKRPDNAISRHCRKAQICTLNSGGQVRHLNIIPEADVYRLIMKSKLPSAERFEDWVVSNVLPCIRNTGGYIDGISNKDSGVTIEAQRILLVHFKETANYALRELDRLNRYGNLNFEDNLRVLNEISKRTALPIEIITHLHTSGVTGLLMK